MSSDTSLLELERRVYQPSLPKMLRSGLAGLDVRRTGETGSVADPAAIRQRFPGTFGSGMITFAEGHGPDRDGPLRVGVVLSGGQAPGGHNVIVGIHDALKGFHPESRIYGFLGGPKGIFTERYRELVAEELDAYRNTGGFDLIGSGRDKIVTSGQLDRCKSAAASLRLDGLVVVGGDDSNTNAAVLAEYFHAQGQPTAVIGVPKTIDGDLKGGPVEISFGFDTATRVYCELIGNICRDSKSAGKYWHFIKLMGRAASHVTLECALQTHPNLALIGEEVQAKGWTLEQIVEQIARVVRQRSTNGRNYGVCLVPEGLIEFIPEMRDLISALNDLLSEKSASFETLATLAEKRAFVIRRIPEVSARVFTYLSEKIQNQLLLDRDSHGNVQVSKIDTEQMLAEQVAEKLARERPRISFQVQSHFLGYEGRCAAPTNFDADYTYSLGYVAAALAAFRCNGYLAAVRNLARDGRRQPVGVPLTSLMQMEDRHGQPTPVIRKALVDLDGAPFDRFRQERDVWATEDAYSYPGPIQFFGPEALSRSVSSTLRLESSGKI